MELRKYWEIIWRRKWIVIGSFLIILSTAIIMANVATPVYEAKAKVLVEQSNALTSLLARLNLPVNNQPPPQSGETYTTEIALAQINTILEKLISNLNLKSRKGEKIKVNEIPFSIVYLIFPQPYISVEQYQDSDILQITGGSTDRAEAAMIANELSKLYIDDTINKIRDDFKVTRLIVENKIKGVKEEYYRALLEKKDFMIKEATINLEEEIKQLIGYLIDLKNEYKNTEVAIAQADESIALIEKKIDGKEHASSNLINSMESKLNDLLVEVSGMKIKFSEEHPDVLKLNKEIETITRLLRDRMETPMSEKEVSIAPVYEELVRNLKDAYINKAVAEIKKGVLKQYIAKSQDELLKIPSKSTKRSEIDLLLSVNQDIYKNLLTYMTQADIVEQVTLSNIKLVEAAYEPDAKKPYFPKKVLSYGLGIFLGLFCGLFLAFFIEYINIKEEPKD